MTCNMYLWVLLVEQFSAISVYFLVFDLYLIGLKKTLQGKFL